MQNKRQFFFLVVGVPTLGEGGGSSRLGQNPKLVLQMERRNIYTFCSISLCCNVTKDDYSDDEYDVGDGGQGEN